MPTIFRIVDVTMSSLPRVEHFHPPSTSDASASRVIYLLHLLQKVIVDMECFKQDFQQQLQDGRDYLVLSRKLYEDLQLAKEEIAKHSVLQRNRKVRAVSDSAAIARSIIRSKVQQFRESYIAQSASQIGSTDHSRKLYENLKKSPSSGISREQIGSSKATEPPYEKQIMIPKVGEMVMVPSLGRQAQVLKVEASKGEVIVQASNIRLRLKLNDIGTQVKTS